MATEICAHVMRKEQLESAEMVSGCVGKPLRIMVFSPPLLMPDIHAGEEEILLLMRLSLILRLRDKVQLIKSRN